MLRHRSTRANADSRADTDIRANADSRGDANSPNSIGEALNLPYGISYDAAGNIYVADTLNHRVVKVTPEGVFSVIAPNGNPVIADSFNHRILMLDY